MVVTPDADLDLAVEGALFAGFGTAGQRCTSLGTVIVPRVRARRVPQPVRRRDRRGQGRRPVRRTCCTGRCSTPKFAERFEKFLGWVSPQHTVLGSTGTGRITAANPREGFVGDPEAGIFYHPAIVDGVRPGDEIFDQETFGPLVGVTTYQTMDEAIELANAPGYGLSSSIYTNDATRGVQRSGAASPRAWLSVNNSTSGAEAHLPFGGNGKSGNGSRQSGVWVLDQFTRWQSLNWDYSGKLQKAQMDVVELTPDSDFRLA